MEGYNIEKEMREAIEAGENALYSLRAAKEELRKAGNWGIADLLGGGFFVSLIKHSKMDEASRLMEQARYDLKKFQKELRDVTVNTDLSFELRRFSYLRRFLLGRCRCRLAGSVEDQRGEEPG
ncbi:MAG: hypothetical protein ACLR2E_22240 [Lachnospiraceae bacterium]